MQATTTHLALVMTDSGELVREQVSEQDWLDGCLDLYGWTKPPSGDEEEEVDTQGYNVEHYFDRGRYLGPDMFGVEPILERIR